MKHYTILYSKLIDTPLGSMIAIANEKTLCFLDYADHKKLAIELEHLKRKTNSIIIAGETEPITSIEEELKQYFENRLHQFKTPLSFFGSTFQQRVWQTLQTIPLGQTRSYAEIATMIEHPLAYRAVARANGSNKLTIVIPCHRVINSSGTLGGYSGGLTRKLWLINHEKSV